MTRQKPQNRRARPTPQLAIPFPTKRELGPEQKDETIALLSRLLLQVANANNEEKVNDDSP
jgi:hypothetical protein